MTKKYGKCPKCGCKRSYLFYESSYFDLYSIRCPKCGFRTDEYVFLKQAEKEWKWLQKNPEHISLLQFRTQIREKVDRIRKKLGELNEIKFCSTELERTFGAINELYQKINSSELGDLQKCQSPPKERTESGETGSNFNVSR